MNHLVLWNAIDKLAAINNLSCSGLARNSHLDPTTFNRSKRYDKYGKPRWPSTQSLIKMLNATDTTMNDFAKLLTEETPM